MKTKLVYALVSDFRDVYSEEAYVSMKSARIHNPDIHIVLVVDNKTNENLVENRRFIRAMANQLVVVDIPDSYSKPEKSRVLKTTLRKHITGPYLFVDTDTIIADDLSEIDELISNGVDIAAVKDSHVPFIKMNRRSLMLSRAKKVGWERIAKDEIHFNSGVMFVNDTKICHDFYEKWHNNWLFERQYNLYFDQLALAITNQNYNYIIQEIDGKWNCQICQDGLRFLFDAKIVHYFGDQGSGRAYYFRNKELFQYIKNHSSLPEEAERHMKEARKAFIGHATICGDEDMDFYWSSMRPLYLYYRRTFNVFNKFAKCYICISRLCSSYIKTLLSR